MFSDIDGLNLILLNLGYSEKIFGTSPGTFAYPIEGISYPIDENPVLIQLSNLQHNYTLLHFWGPWCHPCLEELPTVNKLYEKFSDRMNFVGIAVDFSFNETQLEECMKSYGITWPNIQVFFDGDDAIIDLYNVRTYPTTFVLDQDLKIIMRINGSLQENMTFVKWISKIR